MQKKSATCILFLISVLFAFSFALGIPQNQGELENRMPGAFIRGVYDSPYLYVAEGGGLSIYDMSSTWVSTRVGKVSIPSMAYDIDKQGDYVYLATTLNGMKVIDVSDPTHPRIAGSFDISKEVYGLDVEGNYAYLADPLTGLWIVDISNPQKPELTNRIPTLIGSVDVVVRDSTAFVAAATQGVYVLNVEDPYSISTISIIDSIENAWTLKLQDNYAYVVDFFKGLAKVDITNLSQPATVSFYSTNIVNTPCYDVEIQGNNGYLACLTQYDIIDLSAMTTSQQINVSNFMGRGVCVWDNKVATLQFFGGVKVFDFTNPSSFIALSHSPNLASPEKVLSHKDLLIVNEPDQGLIVVYNATDPLHPYAVNTQYAYTNDICIYNQFYLYTLEDDYGIATYALNPLGDMTQLGEIAEDTVHSRNNLVMEGNKAFCSYSQTNPVKYGVLAYTLSDETAIVPAGSWDTDIAITKMLTYSNHLYLISDNTVLQILDSSVPSQLTTAGILNLPATIRDISIDQDYLAVVSQDSQLRIYSLTDPAQPELIGRTALEGAPYKVGLNRQNAYLFIPEKGIFQYDLKDPSSPKDAAVYRQAPNNVNDISFKGDIMYISASRESLWMYNTSPQLPGLKLFADETLLNAYRLSDYRTGDEYSIFLNFLGLCSLDGDTVSQGAYSGAAVGTNTFQVVFSGETSTLTGRVNYLYHKINKLPIIGMSAGDDYEVPIMDYTFTNTSTFIPYSYGRPEGAVASDTTVLSVEWNNNMSFTIHCLKDFSEPQYVEVMAGYQINSVYSSYDKERLWVYPNLLADGGLSNASSLNLFGIETCPDKENLGAVSYLDTYADAEGATAQGVVSFSFASTNEGIKATLALDQHIPYKANQWYIARMRVCSPENGSAQELTLFNYGGIASPSAAHVDIAGHIYFGLSTAWNWIETPLYTHETAPGYFQFFLKPEAPGTVYIDDIQLINAEPTLIGNIRKRPDLQFFGGDFNSVDDTAGWSEELFADSLPYTSISSGRFFADFANASTGNIQGAKFTGLDGNNIILTPATPQGKEIGMRLNLQKESGSFNAYDSLVLLGLYGVANNAQYTIAQAGSDLIASAEFGRISNGPHYVVGVSRSDYHQFQFVLKNGTPGILSLDDVDMEIDSDDPYYGDPSLFPEDSAS